MIFHIQLHSDAFKEFLVHSNTINHNQLHFKLKKSTLFQILRPWRVLTQLYINSDFSYSIAIWCIHRFSSTLKYTQSQSITSNCTLNWKNPIYIKFWDPDVSWRNFIWTVIFHIQLHSNTFRNFLVHSNTINHNQLHFELKKIHFIPNIETLTCPDVTLYKQWYFTNCTLMHSQIF